MDDAKRPTTSKERVARHRQRARELELQAAVAAARLALGLDAGDQALALSRFLSRVSRRPDLPEDYASVLAEAQERLSRRRRR
jgi:hypothetical protein